jgi:phage-related protein
LADRGNLCRRPISASIEDGIFELRGTKTTRLLFYFRSNREIVFVYAVTKKTSKLDRTDIEIAKAIRLQIEKNGEEDDIDPVDRQD